MAEKLDAVSFPLSSPLMDSGEEKTVLTVRPPIGKDLRICGTPYKLTVEGGIAIDAAAMSRMIGALTGLLPSSVDRLEGRDWNELAQVVMGFTTGQMPQATLNPD